jgi:hypothetical protein
VDEEVVVLVAGKAVCGPPFVKHGVAALAGGFREGNKAPLSPAVVFVQMPAIQSAEDVPECLFNRLMRYVTADLALSIVRNWNELDAQTSLCTGVRCANG